MYIPGRKRTGSRPSRTVMSFAVYAASAIKKALQIRLLRAKCSVSESAAGTAARQARSSGSRDQLTELRILDLGGCGFGCRLDLGRHFTTLSGRLTGPLGWPFWLRNRAWAKAE